MYLVGTRRYSYAKSLNPIGRCYVIVVANVCFSRPHRGESIKADHHRLFKRVRRACPFHFVTKMSVRISR